MRQSIPISKHIKSFLFYVITLLLCLQTAFAYSERLRIAVAANFSQTAQKIARQFERETGAKLVIVAGSTGKLFAQLIQGAPFDVFLAADQKRPSQLSSKNKQVSTFTYALGRLVYWAPNSIVSALDSLCDNKVHRIALANPKVAPYGRAAEEVLNRLQQNKKCKLKRVYGESVSQAYQYVASGNVDGGFISLAQAIQMNNKNIISVPEGWYASIVQDGALINAKSELAHEFVNYMYSAPIKKLIQNDGYELVFVN
ncbi:MAG: molybdate transport system substrate-binding protein [Lentisphaeria bacterium]|jgi:molybdate transport system substrate-binding protein